METPRLEFERILKRNYPKSNIMEEDSLVGDKHIRFGLGMGLKNGTKNRVNQCVDRALHLFIETFKHSEKELWVVIYEFQEPDLMSHYNKYLYEQFPKIHLDNFSGKIESLESRYILIDEDGNEDQDISQVKILVGKIPFKDIKIDNILRGISNLEMGINPKIGQKIYFFDSFVKNAFHMYDDRGCFVWSTDIESIRSIYDDKIEWIPDYHRPEIDKHFI